MLAVNRLFDAERAPEPTRVQRVALEGENQSTSGRVTCISASLPISLDAENAGVRCKNMKLGAARANARRHMNRLLKFWIAEAGLDPKKYGNESLRRTKALHILKGTGDLEMVRMLLGHAKIESTARFLRVPTTSDPIPISRAFDI